MAALQEAGHRRRPRVVAPPAPKIPRGLRRLGLEKPGTETVPRGVQPMLAKLIDEPFDDPDWVFEPKWDGVRTIAIVRRRGAGRRGSLQSRDLKPGNRPDPGGGGAP